MNRCRQKLEEKKRKKGEEDKIKNEVEDKQWKYMESMKKKEDCMIEEKIKKGKENHKKWEVKRKKEKEKQVESEKKKGDDKSQEKYDEKKEKVKNMKYADNREKYAPKRVEKLTKNNEGVNVSNAFPLFFILISSEEITDKLRIPLASSTFQSESLRVIFLKGPSGNIWRAKLVLDSDGLCFVNGWKEFSIDHHLESGDVLVFSYDGHSQFSVLVFDKSECEKKSAFYACPSSTLVMESENAAWGICYERVTEGNSAIGHLQGNERTVACAKNTTNDITQEEGIDGAGPMSVLPRIKESKTEVANIMEQLDKSYKFSCKTKNSWSKDPFGASQEARSSRLNSMKAISLPHSYIKQEESIDGRDPTSVLPRVKERKRELADIMEQLDKYSKSSRKAKNSCSKDPFVASLEERPSRLNSMKGISLSHSYTEQKESIDGDPISVHPRVKERKRELADIIEQLDKSSKSLSKIKNSWSKDPFVAFQEERSSRHTSMKGYPK